MAVVIFSRFLSKKISTKKAMVDVMAFYNPKIRLANSPMLVFLWCLA